jgi:carboxymethylenebutenolidase
VNTVVNGAPRAVQVEAFLPPTDATSSVTHPAVVMLHGVEGAERYRWAHFCTARWLADRGYAVFFVHYFDGGDYDDLWRLREDGTLDVQAIEATCRRDSERWTSVVTASLKTIAARDDVDRTRMALNGNSLGGFVALSAATAALQDDRVADPCAVVVNWGSLFENTKPVAGFPPTLFVHGANDTVVPLESARKAAETVKAVASEVTLLIVPDASHVARSRESDATTLKFLEKHLRTDRRTTTRVDVEKFQREFMESSLWAKSSLLFR